jgi:hypothetical protein
MNQRNTSTTNIIDNKQVSSLFARLNRDTAIKKLWDFGLINNRTYQNLTGNTINIKQKEFKFPVTSR